MEKASAQRSSQHGDAALAAPTQTQVRRMSMALPLRVVTINSMGKAIMGPDLGIPGRRGATTTSILCRVTLMGEPMEVTGVMAVIQVDTSTKTPTTGSSALTMEAALVMEATVLVVGHPSPTLFSLWECTHKTDPEGLATVQLWQQQGALLQEWL